MISSIITVAKLKEILISYFIKRGLDNLINKKDEEFQNRLKTVIDNTILEYMNLYPVNDCDGKHGFYKSQRVIDELLKYRLMSDEYNLLDLEKAFEDEEKVITPDKKDIENFYNIFIDKINADELLKQLEISSTFNEEIFKISKKLDNISKSIENVINNIHTQLDSEWERQINVYKDNIYSFKPITALDLLIKLESSFDLIPKKPSNTLKATIEYLKGQCYELMNNGIDMHKCYIKAYRLDSSSITFKEKACFAFAINDNHEEAQKLITELLQVDEYNPVAWAVRILISETKDLVHDLANVNKLVLEDINFKRIIFFNTRSKFEINYLNVVYEKYSIVPKLEQFEQTSLTYKNYKNRLFLIESTISRIFQTIYFDFNHAFAGDIELVKYIKPQIEDFLTQLSESEIIKKFNAYKFFNEYFQYVIDGDENSVIKMKLIYDGLENKEGLVLLLIANCLQQINKEDEAIMIINKQSNKSLELLHLEAFCFIKQNDINNYVKNSHEILKATKKIDLISCENILSLANTLHAYGRIDNIKIENFVKDKDFEFPFLRVLIEEFINVLLNQSSTNTIEKLQAIESEILNSNTRLVFYIPFSYFLLRDYENAICLFRKYVNVHEESRDLFYYILSLDKALVYNEELLKLLKHWRLNFSFNEELLRIEADLRRQLSDWNSCFDVCEYFLDKIKNEESFLTLYLISVNELNRHDKEKIIQDVANTFSSYYFKQYAHAQIVSNILIQNGYHKIALEILYNHAIVKENKQARLDYFHSCINVPYEIIKEKEVVEKGLYVKYELNGEIKFVEINDSNILSKSLIGHIVGDEVTVQRPMVNTFDTVKIIRIMDKFLYLHDEILEEVKNNPYSGIPIQSFEFKDMSPEGLVNTLVSLFGASGTVIKDKCDNAFLQYYNYRISFSDIIIQNYSSDYIGGYFNLIHYRDGITQIPACLYPMVEIFKFNNIVLDLTSLLMLFQISREHSVTYHSKFIISKGIVDYVKTYKKNESTSTKEQMSLEISMNGVTKSTKPEEVFKSNIQYLVKLNEWIENNCIIKIAESRLNVTRRLDKELRTELFANYIIDNISLVLELDNSILITDDAVYLKFFPLQSSKTLSTELFVASCFNRDAKIMSEFIKNKYIGMTVSKDILLYEFNKKIKDQINHYNHCLNNLSLALNPSRQNIFTVIKFLKEVSQSPLLIDNALRTEAVNAFVILLKGQKEFKVFRIVELLINKEFKLLGTKLDLIRNSYYDAISILDITR